MRNLFITKFLLVLAIVASSCTGKVEKGEMIVQVSESALPLINHSSVTIASVLEFAEPDGPPFGFILRVIESPGHYYLLAHTEKGNQVYRYDLGGNFAGRIGQIGNGPGEYVTASDVAFDFENDRIFVLDNAQKIQGYDAGGNFLNAIQGGFSTESFEVNQEGQFFQYTALDEGYGVVLSDATGKTIREHLKKKTIWYPIEERNFHKKGKNIYFREVFSNTLFRLDEAGAQPLISFHWEGKNYMPEYDHLDLMGIFNLFAVEGKLLLFGTAVVGKNKLYACFSDEKEGISNHILYNLQEDKVSGFRIANDQGLFFAMIMNEADQPGFFVQGIDLKRLFTHGELPEGTEPDDDAMYLVFLEF